jgi:hypothetical protein
LSTGGLTQRVNPMPGNSGTKHGINTDWRE